MDQPKNDAERALRFIASGGWADENPETVAELLEHAHTMATLILADGQASAQLRAAAQEFLDRHEAGESPAPYVRGTLLAVREVVQRVGLISGLDALLFR